MRFLWGTVEDLRSRADPLVRGWPAGQPFRGSSKAPGPAVFITFGGPQGHADRLANLGINQHTDTFDVTCMLMSPADPQRSLRGKSLNSGNNRQQSEPSPNPSRKTCGSEVD
jgi:hypothetical protein